MRISAVVHPECKEYFRLSNLDLYLLLEALDDIANEPPGDAVRLDHDEGLLLVSHLAQFAAGVANVRVGTCGD